MSAFYHDGSRALQDRFDTRRLADRIEQRLVADRIGPEDRAFIESLDTDRLRSLGWRPGVALEDGIRATLDWVREAA